MAAGKMFKTRAKIVGVITTLRELRRASHMRQPPDLFEIRLDHLVHSTDDLEEKLSILRRPLIVTARNPREGGVNDLSLQRRRELLARFLPFAQYIDVELRSVRALKSIIELARRKKVRCIMSFHDFGSMPGVRSLHTKALAAKRQGADIFKVAARTDSPAQLARLCDFAGRPNVDLPMSLMGIGKLGAESRVELVGRSALVYAAIGRAKVRGQMSIPRLRTKIARIG